MTVLRMQVRVGDCDGDRAMAADGASPSAVRSDALASVLPAPQPDDCAVFVRFLPLYAPLCALRRPSTLTRSGLRPCRYSDAT